MSLLDSLLLDPARLDVWIAARTDGVKGSGTEGDPYDGSVVQAPALSVASLTNVTTEATATTATNHGYANGDFVKLAGVTGGGAAQFNGTFPIYSVTSNTFKYRMVTVPGAPSAGTITSSKATAYQFDALMNSFGEYTTIHLGPGTFETRGYSNEAFSGGHPTWQPKKGMKILGSSIDVTILKIVNAGSYNNTTLENGLYFAISSTFGNVVHHLEISDLTIDSNMSGQPEIGRASCRERV